MESLDGASFIKALASSEGLRVPLVLTGMAKRSTSDQHFEFTIAGCEEWVQVPVAMVDKVTPLGKSRCHDHTHDYVAVQFKQPSGEEAKVLAALLLTTQATGVSQTDRGVPEGASQPRSAPCYMFASTVQLGAYMCTTQLNGNGPYWNFLRTYDNDPGCRTCNSDIPRRLAPMGQEQRG